MFALTERCKILREEALSGRNRARYNGRRHVYYLLGLMDGLEEGLSNSELEAKGMAYVLQNLRPHIDPKEWIVGFNYGNDNIYLPPDKESRRKIWEDSELSEDIIQRLLPIETTFNNLDALCFDLLHTTQEESLSKAEQQALKEWAAEGYCAHSTHSVIGYEQVLKKGFSGLLEEINRYEAQNGSKPLYQAMRTLCETAGLIGEAYATEAKRLLDSGDPAYDPADLERIYRTCKRVPHQPATSFFEAVQSLWFAHILNTWEDGINANSLGRLDQILYPYYRQDIDNGVITQEEAFEILCCLWIKLYLDYDVQQSCVGGTKEDGSDAVNELSYLMLDVTEQLGFIRCLAVRFSGQTDKAFLRRAMQVIGHTKNGIPFFFNDDVMIPALVKKGISLEHARDYTQIGCVETVIPGRSNPHAVTGKTNLLKALEYTMCDGHSMMYPDFTPGLPVGSLDQFDTFERFYTAVLRQADHILEHACSGVKKARQAANNNYPHPFKSLLTEGCLESGEAFNGEGPLYDYYQIALGGVPNLADSLAVIRKFVYADQRFSLSELKTILEQDFPDESIRQESLHKVPKYGNDIDEVDQLAADIVRHCCKTLERLSETFGLCYHAQPFTYLWMIEQGRESAASPDGRHKGEITAYSCSPMQGRDMNGLTALFNSLVKLPTLDTPGTTSAIVEVDPKLFCDDNIDQLTSILVAAAKKGLSNVQFNITDVETLRDAQEHPEKHPNLEVRVSGFSQKFVLLNPQLQEHIISRNKHTTL